MSHLFDEMIGRWALNDDAGNGVWKDTSVNSLNFVGAAAPGAVADPSSVSGAAIGFNGTSQHLQLSPGSMTGFDTSSNYTFSGWFRVNSFPATQMPLLAYWNNTPADKSFLIRIENDQKLKFWHSTSGTNVHSLASTVAVGAAGIWHHFFLIQDTNKVRMFLDNTLIGSGPVAGTLFQPTSAFLWMGRHKTSGGLNQYFNGQMDDFIIWRKALTTAQRNEVFGLSTDFMTKHAPTGIFPGRHELVLGSDKQIIHEMKRNDLQPHFYFHLMDSNFNDIDISSFSLNVNMAHISSATTVISVFSGITFTDTVNGDNASIGKGHYTWGSSDTQIPGTFAFDIEGTPATGGKITFPNPGRALIVVNSDVVNE